MKSLTIVAVVFILIQNAVRAETPSEWRNLFDMEFTHFEKWLGPPHEDIKGLPPGTPVWKAPPWTDEFKGAPMGLNYDPKNVYSMIEEAGEPVLHITGEIFGGLTTKEEFENYHLQVHLKWGESKWAPRAKMLRDSGILYHCFGEHGGHGKFWKVSLECQVQEGDLGDFYALPGTEADVRSSLVEGAKRRRYDPESDEFIGRYVSAWPEADAPHGEWNLMEVYTIATTSVHRVNGQVVMVVENARNKDGAPLTRGQIQLQSEGAECFYKGMRIRMITEFPAEIRSQMRLKNSKK